MNNRGVAALHHSCIFLYALNPKERLAFDNEKTIDLFYSCARCF